jgi:hypothetical protein
MLLKTVFLHIRPITKLTLEGFLSRMNPNVNVHLSFQFESLLTVGTLMLPHSLPTVNHPLVNSDILDARSAQFARHMARIMHILPVKPKLIR